MRVCRRDRRGDLGARGLLWAHPRSVLALHRRGLVGPVPRSRRYEYDAECCLSRGHSATGSRSCILGCQSLPGLAEEVVGNLGHMAALVARALEFVLARLAAAVEAGDGGGSVGRSTGYLT